MSRAGIPALRVAAQMASRNKNEKNWLNCIVTGVYQTSGARNLILSTFGLDTLIQYFDRSHCGTTEHKRCAIRIDEVHLHPAELSNSDTVPLGVHEGFPDSVESRFHTEPETHGGTSLHSTIRIRAGSSSPRGNVIPSLGC